MTSIKPQERILLYGANLWYFGEGMLGPLFAVFAGRVGGDVLDVSWAYATFLVVSGVLIILFGKLADHHNKAALMVLGYVLNAAFTFGYLAVHSPAGLFVVQAGLGVALALAAPTWDALFAKYENPRDAGLTWGLAGGEASLAAAAGIVIGGLVVTYVSFTALFLLMGVVQTIAAVYQARILKLTKRH